MLKNQDWDSYKNAALKGVYRVKLTGLFGYQFKLLVYFFQVISLLTVDALVH